jgi:hypothetical protein
MNNKFLEAFKEKINQDPEILALLDGTGAVRLTQDKIKAIHELFKPFRNDTAPAVLYVDWLGTFKKAQFDPNDEEQVPWKGYALMPAFPSWLWVTHFVEGCQPELHRAMCRALVRWTKSDDLQTFCRKLFKQHHDAAAQSPMDETLTRLDSLRKCLDFRRRVEDDRVGTTQLLLPVVRRLEDGSLIEPAGLVKLTVDALAGGDGGASVILAPWSFFEINWEKTGDVQTKLLPALQTRFAAAADHRFVVSLSPLRYEDFSTPPSTFSTPPSTADKQWAAWTLTPGSFVVEGPSLGLPLAVGASASHAGQILERGIATGKIDEWGAVGSVFGSLSAKVIALAAFLRAQSGTNLRWQIFAEKIRDKDELKDLLKEEKVSPNYFSVHGAKMLTDGEIWTNATDGFSQHRRRCETNDPLAGEFSNTLCRTSYAASLDDSDTGGNDRLKKLADWLSDNPPLPRNPVWSRSGGLITLPVRFNNDPSEMARHLEFQFCELREGFLRKSDANCPALIRISVAELFTGNDQGGLAGVLSRIVNGDNNAFPECLPGHITNALRKPGKLILVLHDVKSDDLWDNRPTWESRSALLKPLFEACANQTILVVCSDIHHEEAIKEIYE